MIQRREIARGRTWVMISVEADMKMNVSEARASARASYESCPPSRRASDKPLLPQISSRHLTRLFNSQQPEHRRRYIFQCSTCAKFHAQRIFVDQVKRDRVRGVRRVRLS